MFIKYYQKVTGVVDLADINEDNVRDFFNATEE